MRNILITGGTGFIGANLCQFFYDLGYEIFYTGSAGENKVKGTRLDYDFSKIEWKNLPKMDALIHMAAITDTTVYDRELMIKVNFQDSVHLFKQALKRKCRNIVYASSCAVYGDHQGIYEETLSPRPLNPYAESKVMLDDAVMSLDFFRGASITGLRFSNVYGPNEQHKGNAASMVSRLLWQIRQGNPTLFKDGSQRRDWVYYKDVIQAVYLAVIGNKYGIYNIGRGRSVSFNDVVKMWSDHLNVRRDIVYIDNPFEGKYQGVTEVDVSKAQRELGYNSHYSLDEGMKDYLMS